MINPEDFEALDANAFDIDVEEVSSEDALAVFADEPLTDVWADRRAEKRKFWADQRAVQPVPVNLPSLERLQ